MEQSIVEIISQHGYLALYILLVIGIIGLPLPDETLMTFVGSLTAEGGMLKYGTTLVISYCGAMTGMLVSYLLGYRIGQPFLYRFGKWVMLTPARLDKAEGWFHRYGLWTVFFRVFCSRIKAADLLLGRSNPGSVMEVCALRRVRGLIVGCHVCHFGTFYRRQRSIRDAACSPVHESRCRDSCGRRRGGAVSVLAYA